MAMTRLRKAIGGVEAGEPFHKGDWKGEETEGLLCVFRLNGRSANILEDLNKVERRASQSPRMRFPDGETMTAVKPDGAEIESGQFAGYPDSRDGRDFAVHTGLHLTVKLNIHNRPISRFRLRLSRPELVRGHS